MTMVGIIAILVTFIGMFYNPMHCINFLISLIITIFIYKYLSPQANLWVETSHSFIYSFYAKLSNLGGVTAPTNEMRASA